MKLVKSYSQGSRTVNIYLNNQGGFNYIISVSGQVIAGDIGFACADSAYKAAQSRA